MKFPAIFAAVLLVVFAFTASAVCLCEGGPTSASCKACGSGSSGALVSYSVKSGQTLYDISSECGVDAETIKQENNLGDNAVLQSGQVLQIPGGKCNSFAGASSSGSGSFGTSFLQYWQGKGLRTRGLPGRCFDSKMNSLLDEYMKKNGLYQRGFDRALVISLIAQESSCNHGTNAGGLMQVDFGCLNSGGCTLEENINKGTRELAQAYDFAKSRGVTGADLPSLIFFGYNRGKGTESIAIRYRLGGTELHESMVKACYKTNPCSSGRSAEWCCNRFGLGAGYPEAVASYYASASRDSRLTG